MTGDAESGSMRAGGGGVFATTHWSVVLAAGGRDPERQARALEQLCRTYWYPIYAHVRRRGHGPEDAQDLTQEFFARVLEKQWLDGIEQNGSRFRSFLVVALNRFLANQYDHAQATKRGGGQALLSLDAALAERRYASEPATKDSPARVFDRHWALTVLGRGLNRLQEETAGTSRERTFELLNEFLSREPEAGEYADLAAQLGLSPGAVSVSVHRLRHRYRELVELEVSETLADPTQVRAEMQHLLAALREV